MVVFGFSFHVMYLLYRLVWKQVSMLYVREYLKSWNKVVIAHCRNVSKKELHRINMTNHSHLVGNPQRYSFIFDLVHTNITWGWCSLDNLSLVYRWGNFSTIFRSEVKVLEALKVQFPSVMTRTQLLFLPQSLLPIRARKSYHNLFGLLMMLLKWARLQEEGAGEEAEAEAELLV